MTHSLKTKRLNLHPCQRENLDAVHQLWNQAEVKRFLFDDRQISVEEVRSLIEASIASFANHSYGIWLFFEHQSDLLAGFSGLMPSSQEPPTLIFGTRPQLWGRGYAKEAAFSILQYAFDRLGVAAVRADVDQLNQASIRVLEAVGLSRTGNEIVNDRPLIYYQIQAWEPKKLSVT